jgi:hypothetical protein
MEIYLIVFAILIILLMVVLLVRLSRSIKKRVDEARNELSRNGFVKDTSFMKPIGTLTRVWGKLPAATPLYLQVSSFDSVSVAVGNSGFFDIKVGDPEFDATYVVRSNNKDKAIQVLGPRLRKAILEIQDLRFRTGSIISLMGVDYFPEVNEKELRNYWMIECPSELGPHEVKKLHNIALVITQEIQKVCEDWPFEKKLETSFFEGR